MNDLFPIDSRDINRLVEIQVKAIDIMITERDLPWSANRDLLDIRTRLKYLQHNAFICGVGICYVTDSTLDLLHRKFT